MKDGNFFRRNPSFVLLWIGQILSQSGGRMYQMAMIWWILSLADQQASGLLVGLFMVTTALPSVLLVKKIGSQIDRTASQKLLVTCDLLACCTVGLVAFLLAQSWLVVPLAFAAGFAAAVLQAFIDPTLNKAVGDVVGKDDFESAVALLSSTQSLANFSGAVAGAILIDKLGIAGTAALAAIGYFISSACSQMAAFAYGTPEMKTEGAKKSGWALLDGYPFLKKILVGFGLINFFATPTLVVLPIYVKKTLGGSAGMLGQLEAALWIGLLAGTFGAKFLPANGRRVRLGAMCLVVFGACLLVPWLVQSPFAYMSALAFGGAAIGINNVKFMSLFQEIVAPEIKGRFFALMQATIGFSFPIAYFLFGVLTDIFPPPWVCFIQGSGVVLLSVFFMRLSKFETTLTPSAALIPEPA